MHGFRKAGLVALSLAVIGTIGCSKSRGREQDDDDDDDDPAPVVNPPPGTAQAATSWTFDSPSAGQPPPASPSGRTGPGPPAPWAVRASAAALSGPNRRPKGEADRTA